MKASRQSIENKIYPQLKLIITLQVTLFTVKTNHRSKINRNVYVYIKQPEMRR